MWAQVTFPRGVDWEIDNYLVSTKEVRIQKCSSLLSDSTFASCGEFNNFYKLWTAYTTFFNLGKLFTAFSSCCDIIKQLVSFTAIKSTKQESVSQSVREGVSDKHSQWSDSGPIKMVKGMYNYYSRMSCTSIVWNMCWMNLWDKRASYVVRPLFSRSIYSRFYFGCQFNSLLKTNDSIVKDLRQCKTYQFQTN